MRARVKVAAQVAAALLVYSHGVSVRGFAGYPLPDWLSLLLTVGWLVACSNAFNLIDGMDGLATGVGVFATITMLFAALLHDVAKPQTRTVDADGRIRFLGHADEGAAAAAAVMRRLRFSARETGFVATVVREHLRPVQLAQIGVYQAQQAYAISFSGVAAAAQNVIPRGVGGGIYTIPANSVLTGCFTVFCR